MMEGVINLSLFLARREVQVRDPGFRGERGAYVAGLKEGG